MATEIDRELGGKILAVITTDSLSFPEKVRQVRLLKLTPGAFNFIKGSEGYDKLVKPYFERLSEIVIFEDANDPDYKEVLKIMSET